jgi:hypothetical protein
VSISIGDHRNPRLSPDAAAGIYQPGSDLGSSDIHADNNGMVYHQSALPDGPGGTGELCPDKMTFFRGARVLALICPWSRKTLDVMTTETLRSRAMSIVVTVTPTAYHHTLDNRLSG